MSLTCLQLPCLMWSPVGQFHKYYLKWQMRQNLPSAPCDKLSVDCEVNLFLYEN